ncbi:MAG: PAS domain S-box protein [Acidobacteria bacterium]|nr:PAS domain S-box protein [Acidobacteriota bacterium]MCB9399552.1 PAS domain S-box protein [Acidobacteriota bacterium]
MLRDFKKSARDMYYNTWTWVVILSGLVMGVGGSYREYHKNINLAQELYQRQKTTVVQTIQAAFGQVDATLALLETFAIPTLLQADPSAFNWPNSARFSYLQKVDLWVLAGGSERPEYVTELYRKPGTEHYALEPQRLVANDDQTGIFLIPDESGFDHLLFARWVYYRQKVYWLVASVDQSQILEQNEHLQPDLAAVVFLENYPEPMLTHIVDPAEISYRSPWLELKSEVFQVGSTPLAMRIGPLPQFDANPKFVHPLTVFVRSLWLALIGLILVFTFIHTQAQFKAKTRLHTESLNKLLVRFKAHLNNTPLAVIDMDANGIILDWNRSAEKMFGYRAEDCVGKTCNFLFPHQDNQSISGIWLNPYRLLTGQHAITPNLTKNNKIIYCQWFNTPLFNDEEVFEGVIALVENITEKKREEAIRHRQMKWESLGVMAGGICHDFNNLLTGILGNIELAKHESTPQGSGLLNKAELGAHKAAKLVDLLLAFSGKAMRAFDLLEAGELIGEAIEETDPAKPGVLIQFNRPSHPHTFVGDRSQLLEAMRILLRNALEALPEEGGEIRLFLDRIPYPATNLRDSFAGQDLPPGHYIRITCSDTGCGMDERQLERIFDPFFSSKFQGRGMGLSVLSGVVRAHHGGYSVTSAPGKGSKFVLLFPDRAAESSVTQSS